MREFEHITLAKVLVAGSDTSSVLQARRFLERLLQAAEQGGRSGSVIEILVLQALAHQLLGDMRAGLAVLQRAVTLAETEGTSASPEPVSWPPRQVQTIAGTCPAAQPNTTRTVRGLAARTARISRRVAAGSASVVRTSLAGKVLPSALLAVTRTLGEVHDHHFDAVGEVVYQFIGVIANEARLQVLPHGQLDDRVNVSRPEENSLHLPAMAAQDGLWERRAWGSLVR